VNHPFDTLPIHWQQWVEQYAKEASNGKWDRLGASDFGGSVKLRFSDGTFLMFEYAFYAIDVAKEELAVFTEHCGYHIFPLIGDLEYSYNVWAESPGDKYQKDESE